MIYLLTSFSILLLKLSPYLVVGLMFATAAAILIRHLRQLAGGQGSCCANKNTNTANSEPVKYNCPGCSGCSVYGCPGQNENPTANDDHRANAKNQGVMNHESSVTLK